jgi:O-acetyl-ADP-ribose deacetylase (regulator of RNase III)
MIHQVQGDILLSRAECIAHGVAANDHFDSGLALALRERWPSMFEGFRHWCHVEHRKPGAAWTWSGPGARMVALLTQDEAPKHEGHPGRATTHHVNRALRALREATDKEAFSSLALPRLATGVGGLDWSEVEPLVRRHLGDLDIPVHVYVDYRAGMEANESA